ncbi:MAG: DUF975 family protein [Deltaproteobacteria bacterium]|nr:MAG: DUF975 family protein [Deltaproteobacteria bacterium]
MSDESNPFAPANEPAFDDETYDPGSREPANLSPGPVLNRAIELLMENPLVVLAAVIIPVLVGLPFDAIEVASDIAREQYAYEGDDTMVLVLALASLGAQLVGFAVGLFVQLGAIRIFLNLAFGREADIMMLFTEGRSYLSALAASFIMGIVLVVGFLLLIVPGIILSLMLYFTLYLIVDRQMGPIEAMSESMAITDGQKMDIFIINLVFGLGVVAFGCLTLGIGFLVATPVLALVQGVMYHSVVKQRELLDELGL